MISKSVYDSDVRVRREAEALAEDGHEVTVACLGPNEFREGVRVRSTGPVRGLKPEAGSVTESKSYRALRWLLLPTHRRLANVEFAAAVRRIVEDHALAPDVIHAHDLPALEACFELDSKERHQLVYDAHEYWRGMPRYGRPAPFAAVLNHRREQRMAQQADAIISVSEGLANLLSRDLKTGAPIVVRNTFPPRRDLTPPESPRGAVYAGKIGDGRDLATVFSASVWSESNLSLELIGPVEGPMKTPSWAHLYETGSLDDVDRLLTGAGIALVPLERGPINHDVALPNKLFQAISVGIPVVAADLPEMARLVRQHKVGVLYEPGNSKSLSATIRAVVDDYQELVANVRKARGLFDWSLDAEILKSVYRRLGDPDA